MRQKINNTSLLKYVLSDHHMINVNNGQVLEYKASSLSRLVVNQLNIDFWIKTKQNRKKEQSEEIKFLYSRKTYYQTGFVKTNPEKNVKGLENTFLFTPPTNIKYCICYRIVFVSTPFVHMKISCGVLTLSYMYFL